MTGSWTNVFGGAAVTTAQPSYLALSIAANTTLTWPTESTEGANYVASMLDVTATAGSLLLAMPSALLGSTGPAAIVANVGPNSFTLTNSAGTSIVAIATGVSYLISLTGNGTAAGTWRAIQVGATTSAVSASTLAGPGLTVQQLGVSNVLQLAQPSATLLAWPGFLTDSTFRGCLATDASGVTARLDTSANLGSGWFIDIANQSTTTSTKVTCSGGELINGGAQLTIFPGASARITATTGAFNVGGTEIPQTQNAVMLGGGSAATPRNIASLGASGQVLTSNGSGQPPSFQTLPSVAQPVTGNACFNGGCRVGARGDASITVTLSTSPQYGQVDLIRAWVSGGGAAVTNGTAIRSTGVNYSSTGYAVTASAVTTTGAAATINFGYRIEAKDAAFLINQTAIFQCVIYNEGNAQNYVITINKATVADNFGAVTQIAQSGNLSVGNNTSQTISLSAALGSCGNGVEIIVSALIGPVTTVNYHIADFGLFIGSTVVSPFPDVAYDLDLIYCKRYLPRWFWTAVNTNTHSAYSTSTTNAQVALPYDVEPRIAATGVLVGAAAAYSDLDVPTGSRFDCTSAPTFVAASRNVLMVQAASTTNLTTRSLIFFGSGSAGSAAYILATGPEL